MIQANRNHPSIVAWSIGNEIDYPNDPYAHPLFQEAVGNNDAGKPKAERLYDPDCPDIRRLTTIGVKRLAAIVWENDHYTPGTPGCCAARASSAGRASSTTSTSGVTTTRSICTTRITGDSPTSRSSAARTRTADRLQVERND